MGTKFAPQYANLFMHKFEQDFLSTQSLKPSLYLRYIDDIFIIWQHGEEALVRFHNSINSFLPTIRLDLNFSTQSVTFLDTKVSIKGDKLVTSLHRKPTDTGQLLHSSSFHPQHTKKAIPYGQALRIHRICSDPSDRDSHLQTLEKSLINSGYNREIVRRQFDRAISLQRSELLVHSHIPPESERVPFVTQYFPGAEKLQRELTRLDHLISNDTYLSDIFPTPPFVAFRQPPNLKSKLVHSQLPHPSADAITPCNAPRCATCATICTDTNIERDHATFQAKHRVKGRHSCASSHVVYLIRCHKGCQDSWYVGETGQQLRQRMNTHRSRTRNGFPHAVTEHFSLPDHTTSDMHISVLRGGLTDVPKRKIAELEFITKFRTHEHGLNKDKGFLVHYE